MRFHLAIELNDYELLNINGSLGVHCFRWTLRHFWKPEYWRVEKEGEA